MSCYLFALSLFLNLARGEHQAQGNVKNEEGGESPQSCCGIPFSCHFIITLYVLRLSFCFTRVLGIALGNILGVDFTRIRFKLYTCLVWSCYCD